MIGRCPMRELGMWDAFPFLFGCHGHDRASSSSDCFQLEGNELVIRLCDSRNDF